MFSLQNKVAVVTGATGLLGREHCDALAEAGASVVVVDTDRVRCQGFATELIQRHSVDCLGVQTDITEEAEIVDLCKGVKDHFGRLDILINNAAINDKVEERGVMPMLELSRFENFPLEIWQRSIDVNVTGMFLVTRTLGALMAEQRCGSIINIASTYGIVAPDQSLYTDAEGRQNFYKSPVYPATKGAVISLTRYVAAYWGHLGVRCNTLSPGGVEAGQDAVFLNRYASKTPLARMAHPSDYRGAIVFLASDASNYMTGANLVVDGGFTAW